MEITAVAALPTQHRSNADRKQIKQNVTVDASPQRTKIFVRAEHSPNLSLSLSLHPFHALVWNTKTDYNLWVRSCWKAFRLVCASNFSGYLLNKQ